MCGDVMQQPEFIDSMKLLVTLSQNTVIQKLSVILKIILKYTNNVSVTPLTEVCIWVDQCVGEFSFSFCILLFYRWEQG